MLADVVGFGAEAAGDDDLAVFLERFADGIQGFCFGGIQKATGVDDDRVGPLVFGGNAVAFGAQAGQDALAVDQGFRAAQRDHADVWLAFAEVRLHLCVGKVGAEAGRVRWL